jgi:nitrite reductase (NADH) small subunit
MTELVALDSSEVPVGGRKLIKAGGIEIGVFNINGHFYAIKNECMHQRGPVCTGRISGALFANSQDGSLKFHWEREGQILTCPWHGLEFDITTGQCLAFKNRRLREYQTRVEDGKLIVTI